MMADAPHRWAPKCAPTRSEMGLFGTGRVVSGYISRSTPRSPAARSSS
jgi:hypothetical protein